MLFLVRYSLRTGLIPPNMKLFLMLGVIQIPELQSFAMVKR